VLKKGRGRAAATRTGRDLWSEAPKPERLQDLLSNEHFFGTVAVGAGRQRDTNRVANAFREENRQSGSACDDAFRTQTGFSEAEVERVVTTRGEPPIHLHQVLNAGDFRGDDDPIVAETYVLGKLS
jgi:hypothetical protein